MTTSQDGLQEGRPASVRSSSSSGGGHKSDAELAESQGEGETMARGAWGGKVEFILTCIGYAVGLGNVWRFPYLTYKNGGGAFLIPFILMLILIGIPLSFMELSFGQFANLGPIAIWNVSPIMKGIGCSMVFTNLMITLYYNVIISWCLYYFFASMTGTLPWEDCGNYWNTYRCMPTNEYKNINWTSTIIDGHNVSRVDLKSPSDEYFYRKVLQMTPVDEGGINDTGTIVWQLALCLMLAWMIVFFVLIRGISSLGKVVYFTSIFPYVLLTIMLVRGVTLEGAALGIKFYLIPDWAKLGEAQVWTDAATQIFYALGTCSGGLIAMASYNDFKNYCLRDAVLVPVVNICTSIYAGFVIFSVLGYMATMKGVEVADVAASGPGLVFVVYPEGLSTMPVAPLWSILFFMMMMMLGLSSMFSMTETVFCALMDEFPNVLRKTYYRTVALRAVGIICFYLVTLPMVTNGGFYIFTIWDSYTGGFPLLIIGLVEILTITYIYGYKNFAEDIEMMLGKKPSIIFRVCWSVVTPAVIAAVILSTAITYAPPSLFAGIDYYSFPGWSQGIGWVIVSCCLVFMPAVFIYKLCAAGAWKIIYNTAQPLDKWGPASKINRTGRYSTVQTGAKELPEQIEMTSSVFEDDNKNDYLVENKNGIENPNFQVESEAIAADML